MNPLILYRLYRRIHLLGAVRIARLIYRLNFFLTHCSIPPEVSMGERVRLPDYGAGVIFNAATDIGDDVIILPHVVIGQNVRRNGEVVRARIRIGNRVVIGTGAKVIASGDLTIGDGSVVGANAVVVRSLPADVTAVGIPAKIIRQGSEPLESSVEPARSGSLPS